MARLIRWLLLICVVVSVATTAAAAAQPYTGNISDSIVNIYKGILPEVGFFDDYVLYRSGQNEYEMIVGDLEFDGRTIELLGEGKVYQLATNTGNPNGNYYHWSVGTSRNFELSVGDYLVYSSLDDFPNLNTGSEVYALSTLFVIGVVSMCLLVRPLFCFVLRPRGVRPK